MNRNLLTTAKKWKRILKNEPKQWRRVFENALEIYANNDLETLVSRSLDDLTDDLIERNFNGAVYEIEKLIVLLEYQNKYEEVA